MEQNSFFRNIPLLADPKIRSLFFVNWTVLIIVQTYSLINIGFSWKIALIDGGITDVLLAATWLLIGRSLQFYRPDSGKYFILLVWCLIYTAIAIILNYHILSFFLKHDPDYQVFLKQTLPLRFGVAFLIVTWMTVVSILGESLQEKIKEERRKADAEKLAREAELYKLRQQLQPHFLFNSLNSISALVGMRPTEARTMIHQLSDFLRGTLKRDEQQWISLTEELQHLQLYLAIEKVRFGHRLTTDISCDEHCESLQLPPMLLQPIVENAIKFGLYDTTEAVTITIEAQAKNQVLEIRVQNPFDPQTAAPRHGTGFGLTSIKRRLFLLFGRNDLLQTQSENTLFTTTIRIPQP